MLHNSTEVPEFLPQEDMELLESYVLAGCVCYTILLLIYKIIQWISRVQGEKTPVLEPTLLTEVLTIAENNLVGFIVTFILYIGLKYSGIQSSPVVILVISMFLPLKMYTETILITMTIIAISTKHCEFSKSLLKFVMIVASGFVILKEVLVVLALFFGLALGIDLRARIFYCYVGIYQSSQVLLILSILVKCLPGTQVLLDSSSFGRHITQRIQFIFSLKLIIILSSTYFVYLGATCESFFACIMITDVFLLPIAIRYLEIWDLLKLEMQKEKHVVESLVLRF